MTCLFISMFFLCCLCSNKRQHTGREHQCLKLKRENVHLSSVLLTSVNQKAQRLSTILRFVFRGHVTYMHMCRRAETTQACSRRRAQQFHACSALHVVGEPDLTASNIGGFNFGATLDFRIATSTFLNCGLPAGAIRRS